MTHEIKNLIQLIWEAQQQGLKSVLDTVVALEGSSYRRPGVRMLILENGKTFGAEHDTVRLCKAAFGLGWQVTVVAAPDEAKTKAFRFLGIPDIPIPWDCLFSWTKYPKGKV